MDAIPRLNHGAPAMKGAVDADKRQFLAKVARGMGVKARHLASVLIALDQGDGVVTSRYLTVRVFQRVANTGTTVNGQDTVSELTTSFVFCAISIYKTASPMIQTGGCQYAGGRCEDPQEGRSDGAR